MKVLLTLIIGMLMLAGCQMAPSTNTTDNETILLNLSVENSSDNNQDNEYMSEIDDVEDVEEVEETTSNNNQNDNLPSKTFKEGDLVQFKDDLAFDPDGDNLAYTFSAPLDATGKWQTEIGDAGEYIVTIKVSDGKLESTQQARLIIQAVNNPPTISNFNDVTVSEGETIEFDPTVEDADGDAITLRYTGFMTSNTYTASFNDAGEHKVTLRATDGKQEVLKTVTVVVEDVNRKPVFGVDLDTIEVTEGESIALDLEVSDPDGDALSIEYAKPLSEDGTWTPTEGDAGTYDIDVTISDGDQEVTKTVRVVVASLNKAPVLSVPTSIEVNEGETIELDVEAEDADGDNVQISYSGYMTTSTYQTTYSDAGEYIVTVSATDGKTTVSKDIAITVNDRNRPPQFTGTLFN